MQVIGLRCLQSIDKLQNCVVYITESYQPHDYSNENISAKNVSIFRVIILEM